MRAGLYPRPPDLTEHLSASPAEEFWVIKHGIKMSAMPAWGKTHDDRSIWGIVAFLQKLPGLTPEQYRTLVGPQYDHDHADHHHAGALESGDDATGHRHHDDAAPSQAPQR